MLIIETNLMISSSSNYILDSGFSAHLCTSVQDLKEVKELREGKITLRIDNGARVATMAVEPILYYYH